MKRFNFSLQPLLNLKMQQEDQLKNELGRAVRKLEVEKERLEELHRQREAGVEDFHAASFKGVTVEKLKEYQAFFAFLQDRILLQKEVIHVEQTNVDKIRGDLLKIVQEREMLDKLKTRKYEEYLKELEKDEQKINDELISFKRNLRAAGEENG